MKKEDIEFTSEYYAAAHSGTPRGAIYSLSAIGLLVCGAVLWANWAELDEVTRGEGRVIASSKTQLVQSLEGGIVKEILVHTGDKVKQGEVLVRIDDTGFSSNLGELEAKSMALEIQIIRLRHEAEGDLTLNPPIAEPLKTKAANIVANELNLYAAKKASLKTQLEILTERVEQRNRELSEGEAALTKATENLKLANEELDIKLPLSKSGIVPKTDIIKLRREVAESTGQIAVLTQSIPKLEAAIRESEAQVEEQKQRFRQDAHAELSERDAELTIIKETMRAARDRVTRTDIRSPVDGIINTVNTNTVGGVVQAGQTLMEIVPIEDSLFVEAKIRPSDIAFVYPKQPAVVKITAYDFAIYGGLEGEVERISADSVFDENTRENYYLVTIKTLKNQLMGSEEELPIMPGMVASVDILTGKKSVLHYLLKPINKARYEALTER